jgi:hypothetical protein
VHVNRRRLISAVTGGLVCLAGCATTTVPDRTDTEGGADGSTATSTPTRTPTATPTATGEGISVAFETLQPAVLQLYTDAYGVATDGQYLFVRATDSGDTTPPARTDVEFRFAGEAYSPADADGARDLYRLYEDRDGRYDADSGRGWLLFRLPETGDASDAALVWPGGEWRPPTGVRQRLAAPAPTLSVEWSVPETVTRSSEPAMEFSVENAGDVPGRFVAGVNRRGPQIAVAPVVRASRLVPAGETVTWRVSDRFDVRSPGEEALGDGQPDLTYDLVWAGGQLDREVRVVG